MKKHKLLTIIGFVTAVVAIAGSAYALYRVLKKKHLLCCGDACCDGFSQESYSEEFDEDGCGCGCKKNEDDDMGIELDLKLDEDDEIKE